MLYETKWLEAEAAGVFQAESVDVHQYFHALRRREFAEPESRLMFAVLEDALRCLEKYASARSGKGKTLFDETKNWLVSTTNEDEVFSFNNVCEVLGLDPQYVRKAVLQWKTSSLKSSEPEPSKL
jgi:hypothetical protein